MKHLWFIISAIQLGGSVFPYKCKNFELKLIITNVSTCIVRQNFFSQTQGVRMSLFGINLTTSAPQILLSYLFIIRLSFRKKTQNLNVFRNLGQTCYNLMKRFQVLNRSDSSVREMMKSSNFQFGVNLKRSSTQKIQTWESSCLPNFQRSQNRKTRWYRKFFAMLVLESGWT